MMRCFDESKSGDYLVGNYDNITPDEWKEAYMMIKEAILNISEEKTRLEKELAELKASEKNTKSSETVNGIYILLALIAELKGRVTFDFT